MVVGGEHKPSLVQHTREEARWENATTRAHQVSGRGYKLKNNIPCCNWGGCTTPATFLISLPSLGLPSHRVGCGE
jgi:hypothetical protein